LLVRAKKIALRQTNKIHVFKLNDDNFDLILDQFKVIVFEWDNLVGRNKDILQDGKMPLMPATKNIRKNSFENVTKQWKTYWNSDFDVLLKTRFLAVNDGPHSFYSECVSRCKVWIRKDICDTPVLVLEQESWR
jgi:hypothetical protein